MQPILALLKSLLLLVQWGPTVLSLFQDVVKIASQILHSEEQKQIMDRLNEIILSKHPSYQKADDLRILKLCAMACKIK